MRSRRTRWGWLIPVGAALLMPCGCAVRRAELNQALLTDHTPAAHTRDVEAAYRVRCPDIVEITVAGAPALSGSCLVHADGRITLNDGRSFLVERMTPQEIAHLLEASLSPRWVHVRVVGYRSQELFLLSPASEVQRAVPYHGPETVIDFLQRVGGLPLNSEGDEIRVIRAHVADGKPPEVFTIDLRAIVLDHDQQTNVRLEPFDQIHIGVRPGYPMLDRLTTSTLQGGARQR
jgi:polysaccharide biosynthesis/export protein